MNYQDWEKPVPEAVTGDTLWKMKVYRLALFAAKIGANDIAKLNKDRSMISRSDQLRRSLGSVSANIAEGYSRGSGKDRVRFYEYALGSARESRDWYYQAEDTFGQTVTHHRLDLQAQIIRLLLSMIPDQRHKTFKEESVPYDS